MLISALLLGDECEAAEQSRISQGTARFERPRPDVERHYAFPIVASRGGDGKTERFRGWTAPGIAWVRGCGEEGLGVARCEPGFEDSGERLLRCDALLWLRLAP
jgi:hypothetical protein